jgi:hypothetical protein
MIVEQFQLLAKHIFAVRARKLLSLRITQQKCENISVEGTPPGFLGVRS